MGHPFGKPMDLSFELTKSVRERIVANKLIITIIADLGGYNPANQTCFALI